LILLARAELSGGNATTASAPWQAKPTLTTPALSPPGWRRLPAASLDRPGPTCWCSSRASSCSPGRRTVAAALSSVGLRGAATFTNYHRVLNRSRWSGQAAARCLLGLLVAAFVPDGPVVVGINKTIERRWGPRIKARGIYRDPVRSSYGHFVKVSGLRWISLDHGKDSCAILTHRCRRGLLA